MNQENRMSIVIKELNKFIKNTGIEDMDTFKQKIPDPQGGAQNNKGWRIYCSRVGGARLVHAGKVHLSSG